jgi:uncharacterized hydrophobic protein (TIGR00271 family)
MIEFKELRHRIFQYIRLDTELDKLEQIDANIRRDVVFKGTNLWILGFASIIASVGLNMNSTAVIIGAMLISPLMGPINGMGYSIATYDADLFRKSIRNLGFAVLASLVASTAYFSLSPISTAHSELLARTSPTIYDVIIALFGGLAGIVAISSRNKGNVIPGVAIATALMPPLCTAGYGLATLQWTYFMGAIYLFLINTVFIALASVIISQILKLPIRSIPDSNTRKRVNQVISVLITLMILPSIYFGYILVVKERFKENAKQYISAIVQFEGNYLLAKEVDEGKRRINLVYGGPGLSSDQQEEIRRKALDYNLDKATINFRQGLSTDVVGENAELLQLLRGEVMKLSAQIRQQDELIDSLQDPLNNVPEGPEENQ